MTEQRPKREGVLASGEALKELVAQSSWTVQPLELVKENPQFPVERWHLISAQWKWIVENGSWIQFLKGRASPLPSKDKIFQPHGLIVGWDYLSMAEGEAVKVRIYEHGGRLAILTPGETECRLGEQDWCGLVLPCISSEDAGQLQVRLQEGLGNLISKHRIDFEPIVMNRTTCLIATLRERPLYIDVWEWPPMGEGPYQEPIYLGAIGPLAPWQGYPLNKPDKQPQLKTKEGVDLYRQNLGNPDDIEEFIEMTKGLSITNKIVLRRMMKDED